jgi:hypothetical protein
MTTRTRLQRLEARRPATMPRQIKHIAHNRDGDGLYHDDDGATYDEAGIEKLQGTYQLIIVEYLDHWPPGGSND